MRPVITLHAYNTLARLLFSSRIGHPTSKGQPIEFVGPFLGRELQRYYCLASLQPIEYYRSKANGKKQVLL